MLTRKFVRAVMQACVATALAGAASGPVLDHRRDARQAPAAHGVRGGEFVVDAVLPVGVAEPEERP